MTLKSRVVTTLREIQNHICTRLEICDGKAKFLHDKWERTDLTGVPGGGGETRVISDGAVFEKGGVNFSEVAGHLPETLATKLGLKGENIPFFATGVSLVIHPNSPLAPTTHANWRYIEAGDKAWFGGGSDLTPYFLYKEDATLFHDVLKKVCDRHNPDYYPRFKKWCDEYFYLPHRKETRGIGGLFFDYIGKDDGADLEAAFSFVKDLGFAFTEQYVPIVDRRKAAPYSEAERKFQLQRRGRYVEFNLIYDRGTHFGLQTGGRIESILMSLPPEVRWDYNPEVIDDERARALMEVLQKPREWV